MLDLHIHTKYSDGEFSPSETLEQAKNAGVTIASVTDHDTASGIPKAFCAAQELQIKFLPGIEISTQGEKELHILGYGINPEDENLLAFCRTQTIYCAQRTTKILAYLEDCGIPMTIEDVQTYNDGKSNSRSHIARVLVAMGFSDSVQAAFDKYLTTPEFYAFVERPKPTPEEGIRMIRQAGGVAVLAHPYLLHLDMMLLEKLVIQLETCGLEGAEAYYSCHSTSQTEQYLWLTKKHNLLVTCGSDFHGPSVKPDIALGTGKNGNLNVSDETIFVKLQDRIHKRKQNSLN